MFLIAGISPKIKPLGTARGCGCPVCGDFTGFQVIYKYMTPHIFFIPTFRFNHEYIATCPGCASVMSIRKEKGHAFLKNPDTRIEACDLRVLRNNFRPTA